MCQASAEAEKIIGFPGSSDCDYAPFAIRSEALVDETLSVSTLRNAFSSSSGMTERDSSRSALPMLARNITSPRTCANNAATPTWGWSEAATTHRSSSVAGSSELLFASRNSGGDIVHPGVRGSSLHSASDASISKLIIRHRLRFTVSPGVRFGMAISTDTVRRVLSKPGSQASRKPHRPPNSASVCRMASDGLLG